jgi:tetratricopeptide (TPR) repeat protein
VQLKSNNEQMFKAIPILALFLITISCNSSTEGSIITEYFENQNGIRTISYPEKFNNSEAYKYYVDALDCLREDDLECSKDNLEKALMIDSLNLILLNDLGNLETRFKNFDKSTELFLRAINIDSNFYQAYANLGLNYYYAKQYESGVDILKLVEIDSVHRITRRGVYLHLFMNYTGLKNCDSAFHYYNTVRNYATDKLILENAENFKENEFKKNCPQQSLK